jgi:hypothetical protein
LGKSILRIAGFIHPFIHPIRVSRPGVKSWLTGEWIDEIEFDLRIQLGKCPPQIVVAQRSHIGQNYGCGCRRQKWNGCRPDPSRHYPIDADFSTVSAGEFVLAGESLAQTFPQLNHHGFSVDLFILNYVGGIPRPLERGETWEILAEILEGILGSTYLNPLPSTELVAGLHGL